MTLSDSKWYAVRSVFRHDAPATSEVSHTLEERIVLFLAMDGDDAIAKAEREAETYDGDSTGYFMSFELVDDSPFGSGHELFSLMRDSYLTTEQYLDRFHDSGTERSRTADSD